MEAKILYAIEKKIISNEILDKYYNQIILQTKNIKNAKHYIIYALFHKLINKKYDLEYKLNIDIIIKLLCIIKHYIFSSPDFELISAIRSNKDWFLYILEFYKDNEYFKTQINIRFVHGHFESYNMNIYYDLHRYKLLDYDYILINKNKYKHINIMDFIYCSYMRQIWITAVIRSININIKKHKRRRRL